MAASLPPLPVSPTSFSPLLDVNTIFLQANPSFWNSKRIYVITAAWGGSGDTSCAYKIVCFLHDKIGIRKDNIVWINEIAENAEDFNQTTLFPTQACRSRNTLCYLNDKNELVWKGSFKSIQTIIREQIQIDRQDPDLILIGPEPTTISRFLDEIAVFKVLIMPFTEYGVSIDHLRSKPFEWPRNLPLGIRPEQFGIHINRKLVEWSRSTAAELAEMRLSNLANLTETLQIEILGAIYSREKARDFAIKNLLFSGYSGGYDAEEDKRGMIIAVAKMAKKLELDQNLFFCFLGQDFDCFLEEDYEVLRQLGIHRIVWPTKVKELYSKELHPIPGSRQITIINSNLAPDQVPFLLKASEPEILVTGDQFPSEAIACFKRFIYQALPHKRAFLKDMVELACEHFDKEFSDLFKNVYIYSRSSRFSFSIENAAALFVAGRMNEKIQNAWRRFNEFICDERAISHRFTERLALVLTVQDVTRLFFSPTISLIINDYFG